MNFLITSFSTFSKFKKVIYVQVLLQYYKSNFDLFFLSQTKNFRQKFVRKNWTSLNRSFQPKSCEQNGTTVPFLFGGLTQHYLMKKIPLQCQSKRWQTISKISTIYFRAFSSFLDGHLNRN